MFFGSCWQYVVFVCALKQVSRRGAFSDASPKYGDDDDDTDENNQDIDALSAITSAIIMDEVKRKAHMRNKQNIIQIIIYESSV